MALFMPLRDYSSYEHILNALPNFIHPNGNRYGVVVAKRGGTAQNLEILRFRPGAATAEVVHTYRGGGVDAVSQIAAGGCWILPDGSLEAWASAVPQQSPTITKTGFVAGRWEPLPGVDAPWSMSAGGVKLLPAVATNPAWEARTLTAGEMVNIPQVFNVPVATSYLARITVNAPVANVRARFGTEACPHFYTVNSRENGVDEMQQGFIPGPQTWVSPAQGSPRLWFQIIGMG